MEGQSSLPFEKSLLTLDAFMLYFFTVYPLHFCTMHIGPKLVPSKVLLSK
jgi:hypothetical protein